MLSVGINIDIVVPADNFEAGQAIRAAAKSAKPIYIRFGKAALYDLPRPDDSLRSVGQRSCATATRSLTRSLSLLQATYALEGLINYSAATIQWLRDQLELIRDVSETQCCSARLL